MQLAGEFRSRARAGLGLIAVSVIMMASGLSMAMMPTVAGATGSSGVWGAATEIPTASGGAFEGVSCTNATDCTAVGGEDGQPFYATESAGVWGAAIKVSAAHGGAFTGVSCASATDCTAVGHDSNGPMYATESAGVWGATIDVSAHGADSEFYAVSCTAATDCTAVGYDGNDQPFYATESAGVWGAAIEITATDSGYFQGVSCTAATDCTAVGEDGIGPIYATESAGVWGAATEVSDTYGGGLNGVSCAAATDCTAVGFGDSGGNERPMYATESAGSWGAAVEIPTTGASFFDGVSCTDATDCTAVGYDGNEPFYAAESSGVWGAATATAAPGGSHGSFSGVSCTAVTNCTAVGGDSNGQAFYASSTVDGAPTTPTISDLPASGAVGGGFTATLSTTGDGTKSVTSNSTGVCTASGLVVTYVGVGTCSLTAHVAAGTDYGPANGEAQTLSVTPAPPGPYSPLAPVRICDTRAGNPSDLTGAATQCNGTDNDGSTIAANGTKTINVAGHFGVPTGATAVVLTVTVVSPAATGYLSVYPAGATRPTASNINYTAGQVVPNLVEVGTGSSGEVSFFSTQATDIVVDVEGYVSQSAPAGAGAGLYNPLTSPARICDTRAGNPSGLVDADAQCNGVADKGETLSAGGTISVQVGRDNGIPSTATAAVLNVTVVNPTGSGYLTVFPQGSPKPTASNVNYATGQVTANRVIVPLSASGQISVYSSASADVIVDVSGYYSAAGGSGSEFSAEPAPVRICDTRSGNPSGLSGADAQCGSKPIGPGTTLTLNVATLAGVPSNAKAVVVNLTGVAPTASTFLTVFPGPTRPASSDLNPASGEIAANLVVATLNANGTISIFNDAGTINVIVDVEGWYS